MVTINYTPSVGCALHIGRQRENEARKVVIDLSGFIADYGEGTAVLIHQRPGDAAPYIVNAAQEGSTLTWTVTNTDTAFAGRGQAELRWMIGDLLAKSVVFPTRVKASLAADETIPDALQSWYDAMIAYIDDVRVGEEGVAIAVSKAAAAAESAANAAQIAAIAAASEAQQTEIEEKGAETLASIPEDYTALIEDVDEAKSAITREMCLHTSVNKWNVDDAAAGYVAPNGARNTTSTAYVTLQNKIPVTEGDVVRFYGNTPFQPNRIRFLCAYNRNGSAVSSAGISGGSETQYIVPEGITAIIPSLYVSENPQMVTINEAAHRYEPYYDTPYYIADSLFLPGTVRNEVFINSDDTENTIIQKLVGAYKLGNCDVVFERAHYTLGDELAHVADNYNISFNEIPIGNNNRYYFNGATVEAALDLSTLGDNFYCNLFGVQQRPNSFEMHDGILIATDTRYIVHDEAAYKIGTYKHSYTNMIMEYRTVNRTEAIRKCIGGGTGASGVVEITGCVFVTDADGSAVSYHGNAVDVAGAEFMLSMRDCWLSNNLTTGVLSANQSAKLNYINNSSGSDLNNYGWELIAFGNEVR